jgi:ParB family chromosome partitioning protein
MTGYWTPTVASYLSRITKARIGEAVREAVSDEAAERIGGLKKPDMAAEAEALLAGKGWLPSLLRAPVPVGPEVQSEAPGLTEEAA